jgi:RNA polymerase sigma-70 factor (ECF subfamily)
MAHKELVERIRRAAPDSPDWKNLWSILFAQLKPRICGILKKNGWHLSDADVEDLCQEVCVLMFRKIEQYRSNDSFEAWVYRITINRLLENGRRPRLRIVALDQIDGIDGGGPTPETEVLDKIDSERKLTQLHSALALLPDKPRRAVTLRDIEGYSYSEAAQQMVISERYFKLLLHRARQRLRLLYAKHNEGCL